VADDVVAVFGGWRSPVVALDVLFRLGSELVV
jgi:hypothetical protein